MALEQKEKFLPQDILLAILAKVKEKSRKEWLEFRAHGEKIQRTIGALRACRKVFRDFNLFELGTPDLLDCFIFSEPPFPYSPALSDSLEALQMDGYLCRPHADWEILRLNPAGEEYFEKVLKDKFSAKELAQLDQVAGDFLRFITPL